MSFAANFTQRAKRQLQRIGKLLIYMQWYLRWSGLNRICMGTSMYMK